MKKLSLFIVLALLISIIIPAQVTAAEPDMTVIPDNIDFGTVTVGSSSPEEVVTITNGGGSALSIYDIDLTGTYTVHFQITEDNASNTVLPPGVSATVSVQFKPMLAGNKTAYLRIESNNPGGCYFYVDLYGEGISPNATDLSISKLDNPDPVFAGHDLTYTITVTNNGPNDASDVYAFDRYPTNALSIQSTTLSQGTITPLLPQWVIDILEQELGIPTLPPGYSYLTWSVGNLASGASAELTIIATVNPDIQLPQETPINNRAYVASSSDEPNWYNNMSETFTNVEAAPELIPTTLTLEPEFDTNQLPAEPDHTLTLTVKDQYGQGMVETVNLSSVNGTLSISEITTNSDGIATFDISSSTAITDTITATSTTVPSLYATATKSWISPVPTTLTLEPNFAINQLPTQQDHTLTLTVKDQYGQGIVETVNLSSINGTLAISEITTGIDGTATFNISSSTVISDTITATSTTVPTLSDTATKSWTS